MSVVYDEVAADLEKFHVPGASWAVLDGGELIETDCAGVVRADEPAAVVPGTLFQACSISKPVAVFAILRLVDRGLLDLDEDVNRRLTSWQVPPTGDWRPVVTLRHLASHTAGLTVHGFPGYREGPLCRPLCRSLTELRRRTRSESALTSCLVPNSGTPVVAPSYCSSYWRT
jgi:CubicO group peptidase (beta-lactamase class C family)